MKPIVFGKYTLLFPLAHGKTTEIFLACLTNNAPNDERLLVIKRMAIPFNQEASLITQFEDEIRLTATLNHPNIARLIDYGQINDYYFLATEFIHGQNIQSIMLRCLQREHAVPIPIAVLIGIKLCSALHYAHALRSRDGNPLRIVHRDVSQSNVMVSYDGQVKLLDFGLARSTLRSTRTLPEMLLEKLRYLSPEQIKGDPIDGRSDIYSLAIMLWEITIGQQLFDGQDHNQLAQMIINGKFRPPSAVVRGYPASLEKIILRALSTQSAKRYPSALEMQHALEEYTQSASIQLNNIELPRFMQQIFADEISAWQQAQRGGQPLSEHIMVASNKTVLLAEPSGSSTSASRNPSAHNKSPLNHPNRPHDQKSAIRKTMFYGENPDDSTASPMATPALQHHRVSNNAPIIINPEGQVEEGKWTQPSLSKTRDAESDKATISTYHHEEADSKKPTILDYKLAQEMSETASAVPPIIESHVAEIVPPNVSTPEQEQTITPNKTQSNPANPNSANPVKIQINSTVSAANAEPIIGRDKNDLWKKKNDREKSSPARSVATASKTGDWAKQAISSAEEKSGVHPYFAGGTPTNIIDELGDQIIYPHRKHLVIALLAAIAIVGIIIIVVTLHRGGNPSSPKDNQPTIERQTNKSVRYKVQLISEPAGATVYYTHDGRELGTTPLPLELSASDDRQVELRLTGYQAQQLTLDENIAVQKVILQPENPEVATEPNQADPRAAATNENPTKIINDEKRGEPLKRKKKKEEAPFPKEELKDPFK